MQRIPAVLSIAAALLISSGCSSEPPASTFQHDPTVLTGKPFGDPPDFSRFVAKQKERQSLLMADLKRTRGLKELDPPEKAKLMLSPLKLRRMELNSMLKNLDGMEQWSADQRTEVRSMLEAESQWVKESIAAFQSLK